MNDEIKEILESLDKIAKAEYYPEDLLTYKECQLLLDYITNLQEDYEKEHYLVDKLTRQLNDEYKNTEYQCKQKEDYKSRCEKAVDEIQQLIDDVNNKTIIGLNNFLPKLEEIQDKLANGGDE